MEKWELVLLWCALIGYVIGGSAAIIGVVLKRLPERTVLAILALALLLHTAFLAIRWVRLGHGPYLTMFDILSSNIWSFMLIFLIVYWRYQVVRPASAIIMPVIFMLMGWMQLSDNTPGHLPSHYNTLWLYIHISFAKVFSGMVLVAVGLSGIILLRHLQPARERFARLPVNGSLADLAYRFMAIALIFHSLMLVAGAIWAHDAWGRYWNWNALETWSFITWLLLAFAIHLRITFKPSPELSAVLVIGVFSLAFLTFYGVPFFSNAPHKGVM
ncbi:cytochrome c biogenesis protein [Marinobacter sp.]|uniref:cytochrome c biogenesis protein n=1 Tax=Marinobacter sp. TaxID=50741 RepID=UPI002B483E5D|nr:cytochrome c biogenesis protein CcsA [Marinobacter sp.]HKK55695.1 cytochrome c biogenesis protein CcsA [Marinobacter sp.]